MVSLNGKFGFVDRVGNRTVKPQFDYAEPFFRSYARVSQNPIFGYIGVAGNILWDPRQASNGFVNLTRRERARIAVSIARPYNRVVDAPPFREPIAIPYPAEHLYEEVLPQPTGR